MTNPLKLTTNDPVSPAVLERTTQMLGLFIWATHHCWEMEPEDAFCLLSGETCINSAGGEVMVELHSSRLEQELEAFLPIALIMCEVKEEGLFGRDWLKRPQAYLNGLCPIDLMLTGMGGMIDLALHMRNELLLYALDMGAYDPDQLH